MAARDRDDVGTRTVEIAFNVRAFAIAKGGQPMSGWLATGLSPAFGDASVHIRPRMSLLYGQRSY